MSVISIEWLDDTYDCGTCGASYATGARVTKDGKPFIELIPRAHCYNEDSWDTEDVYKMILTKLGHKVISE